ncbi:MAG: 50S ribosomal protein L15e [Candidatus Altiarchaeota archaeon]|nr:50S ribosomal protein L15e [Candidatus Altiarchaeota archaeon]
MGYQKYVKDAYKHLNDAEGALLRGIIAERRKELRNSRPIVRLEHPTRIDQAHKYGYKAKQGFTVARVRIRAGGMRKARPSRGSKPIHFAIEKITPGKSIQRMAEERASKRYSNMEVLGSYKIFKDGRSHWFEVILVDPSHPAIQNDKDVSWLATGTHRNRALRGLTPAGRRGRGLYNKGKGSERSRPSIRANRKRAK